MMLYLQGIQTAGPIYNGTTMGPIQAYCDADYATNRDRKSISGYLFLASALISGKEKTKQRLLNRQSNQNMQRSLLRQRR